MEISTNPHDSRSDQPRDPIEYNPNVNSELPDIEELIKIRTHESFLRTLEKKYLNSMQQWNKS